MARRAALALRHARRINFKCKFLDTGRTPDGHRTDTGRTPDGHRTDTGRTYGDPRGVIGGVLYEAESIFNVIFEIYAVFTCYLTYYKPSAKKVGRARRTPAKSILNIIFEFSAVFTCYLTYYKPIAKKDCLACPRARRGCAVHAKWDFFIFMNLFYQYI